MAQFYASKIVSALPSTLEANTLYLIRTGTGFDLYCSDSTGSIAHKLNPSGIQGPATSVVGNVAVFDNATGNLIKDRAVTTVNIQGNSTGTSSSGPELVTNGFFSNGSTGWTLGNGWTMVDGKPTFDLSVASPGNLSTTIAAEAFAAYSTNTSVTISNPEVCYIEIKSGQNSIKLTRTQSNYFILTGPAVSGNVTIEFIPNIDSSATGTIKVNNLSCKKANVVPAVASVSGGDERIDFRQYRGSINIGGSGAYRKSSDVLNVSIGMGAAGLGITNSNSVFVGNSAGSKASSVYESTLVGFAAGNSNLGNFNNTLVGAFCGQNFWSGDYNTAIGHSALGSSRSGSNNSALGVESGYKTGTDLYIKIPTNCTYIGASTKASTVIPINETVLGANAIGAGDNTVQLGDPNITLVQTSGQLKASASYTNTSTDVPNLTIDAQGNIKRSTSVPATGGISGPTVSTIGNVAVFDNITGNLVADKATTIVAESTSASVGGYGPNIITNGSFTDSSDGWVLGAGWTFSSGSVKFTFPNTPTSLKTTVTLVADKAYFLQYSKTMTPVKVGDIGIYPKIGTVSGQIETDSGTSYQILKPTVSGAVDLEFIPYFYTGASGTVSITDISLQELSEVDSAFTVKTASKNTEIRTVKFGTYIGNGGKYATGTTNLTFGDFAGENITGGSSNIFVGYRSGRQSSQVLYNTFVGTDSGTYNINGSGNSFYGYQAGYAHKTGNSQTFIGQQAGYSDTSGYNTVAVGFNSANNSVDSKLSRILVNGVYLGSSIKTSSYYTTNEIVIGYNAIGAGDNTVQLGNSDVTLVSTNGQLKAALSYTNTSSDAPNLTIDSFGNIKRSTASLSGLPDQTGQEGKFLSTDGTNPSWQNAGEGVPVGGTTNQVLAKASNTDFDTAWVDPSDGPSLPDVAGNSGKFLSNDGTDLLWGVPDGTLPSPAGNSGKYLTTDGTNVFWDTVPSGSIAPGTIQYFATDPGAGWLKGDGFSTYLRSSYPDLSDALPINLLNCPPIWNVLSVDALADPSTISNIDSDGVFFVAASGWGGLGSGYFYRYNSGGITRLFQLPSGAPAGGGYGTRCVASGANHKYWAVFTGVDVLKWGKLTGTTSFSWLPQPATVATGTVGRGSCAWNADGTKLALACPDGMWLYTRSGDELTLAYTQAPTTTEQVNDMAWSPDGNFIAIATDGGGSPKKPLRVYRVGENAFEEILPTPTGVPSGPANYTISWLADSNVTLAGGSEYYRENSGAAMFEVTPNGMNQLHTLVKFTSSNSRFASHRLPLLIEGADAVPMLRIYEIERIARVKPRVLAMSPPTITSRFTSLAITAQGDVCIAISGTAPQTMAFITSDTTKLIVPYLYSNGLQGWIKT